MACSDTEPGSSRPDEGADAQGFVVPVPTVPETRAAALPAIRHVAVEPFVPIGYRLWGPGAGVPLVICPGLGAYHLQWEREARIVSGTRPVLQVDLRGHGASAMVRNGRSADYSLKRLARDLIGVIEHCGFERVDFLGNSLGGMVGLEVARLRPDLLRGLITCGTAYRYRLPAAVIWARLLLYVLLGRRLPGFVSRVATTNKALRPRVREMYANASIRVLHLIERQIRAFDGVPTAEAFPGPTAILRGERDGQINRHLDRTITVLADRPDLLVLNLPEVGHFTNLDRPELFMDALWQALAFIDGRAPKETCIPPDEKRREHVSSDTPS